MSETVPVIGVLPQELPWVRMLVMLLRHPDPKIAELTRQALLYVTRSAGAPEATRSQAPGSPSGQASA